MQKIWDEDAIQDILRLVRVDENGDTVSAGVPYVLGLHLQNFQSIGYPGVTIPLRPLTLQYGPNSAGKSIVADALTLLRSLFDSGDEVQTPKDLLRRWASRHRLTYTNPDHRKVCISVVTFMTNSTLQEWADDAGAPWRGVAWRRSEEWNIFGKYGPIDRAQFFKIDYEFSDHTNQDEGHPGKLYLSGIGVSTIDGPLISLKLNNINSSATLEFMYKHPMLIAYLVEAGGGEIPGYLILPSANSAASFFRKSLGEIYEDKCIDDGTSLRIDAIDFFMVSRIGPRIWSEHHEFCQEACQRSGYEDVAGYLDFLFSGLGYAVRDAAENMSVPPIRPIPSASKVSYLVIGNAGWIQYDGEDCWKALAEAAPDRTTMQATTSQCGQTNPTETTDSAKHLVEILVSEAAASAPDVSEGRNLLDYVNRSLANPMFLGTRYRVAATVESRHLPEESVQKILEYAGNGRLAEISQVLASAPKKIHVQLLDARDRYVEIEDVGAGISQVIPILVACHFARQLHVQQPELHLHPKLQAQMADVFIERVNASLYDYQPRHFVIETHSEHLMLRVLRRIRETSRANIPNRLFSLTPEQVAVLYFDQDDDGVTTVKHLRISPDGEFIDRWPKGFFTEREADLFDDDDE